MVFGKIEFIQFAKSIVIKNDNRLEANGMTVTMAKISRELQTVCCVGLVYTPPYLREKGYASTVVQQ
jgi:predicted GNAT family acetyltransferase